MWGGIIQIYRITNQDLKSKVTLIKDNKFSKRAI